jgi:GNAT superfamily N-acetyltransferase
MKQESYPITGFVQRLIEGMPIKMGINYSDVMGESMLETIENNLLPFKEYCKDLGKKDGLELFSRNVTRDPVVFLAKGEQVAGAMTVTPGKLPTVHAVWIRPEFRGKGLGPVLYLGGIHTFGKLYSSANIGIMAVKTWHKVSSYCNVRLMKYWVDRKDEYVDFTWGSDGIPVVDGKPINKMRTFFVFEGTLE